MEEVADMMSEAEPVLTPAGKRLLDTAADLFYRRGIHAVGVELIAEQAGTTKKTLYDRFGSKDELVARYLRRRAGRWQRFLLDYLDRQAPSPGPERALAVFDALGEWHGDFERGCAFVNAYAELGGTDHPALAVVRADKRWMRQLFWTLARDARLPEPQHIGNALHLLYEGALVMSTAAAQPRAISDARAAAVTLMSAAQRAA